MRSRLRPYSPGHPYWRWLYTIWINRARFSHKTCLQVIIYACLSSMNHLSRYPHPPSFYIDLDLDPPPLLIQAFSTGANQQRYRCGRGHLLTTTSTNQRGHRNRHVRARLRRKPGHRHGWPWEGCRFRHGCDL